MEALVVKWLLSQEMDTVIQVQILGKAVSIPQSVYNLRKSMNPTISPQLK